MQMLISRVTVRWLQALCMSAGLGCAVHSYLFHAQAPNLHAQVIKSPEWGEVLWRQYELPTNLRCLRLAGKLSVWN